MGERNERSGGAIALSSAIVALEVVQLPGVGHPSLSITPRRCLRIAERPYYAFSSCSGVFSRWQDATTPLAEIQHGAPCMFLLQAPVTNSFTTGSGMG